MNANKLIKYLSLIIFLFIPIFLNLIFPDFFYINNAKINDFFFKLRFTMSGKEHISPYLRIYNLEDEDYAETISKWPDIFTVVQASSAKTAISNFISYAVSDGPSIRKKTDVFDKCIFPGLILNSSQDNSINDYNALLDSIRFHPQPHRNGNPAKLLQNRISFLFNDVIWQENRAGIANLFPDEDGIIRRIPLFFLSEDGYYYPSLFFTSICHYLDINPSDTEFHFGRYVILHGASFRMDQKDMLIPIDDKGQMIINYPGPLNFSFDILSSAKLIREPLIPDDSSLVPAPPSLVLLGDISSWSGKFYAGIYDSVYPENFILASALNTVLTENYLRSAGFFENALLYLPCLILLALFVFLSQKFDLKFFAIVLPVNFVLILLLTLLLHFGFFLYFKCLPDLLSLLLGLIFSIFLLIVLKLFESEDERIAKEIAATIETDKIEDGKNPKTDNEDWGMNEEGGKSNQNDEKSNRSRKLPGPPVEKKINNKISPTIDPVKELRLYNVKTEKEVSTALLLLDGRTYIEIMYELRLNCEATVAQRARRIYGKCRVHNRQELIRLIYGLDLPHSDKE